MAARSGSANRARSPGRTDLEKSSVPAKVLQYDLADGRHDADGWLYMLELVDCGKGATGRCRKCRDGAGHGLYWYRYRCYDGKMHKRYVDKSLPALSGPA